MPFVVPGVCRFAAVGIFSSRDVVNVFDIRIDTTGSTMAREDAIADQAAVLIESISDHMTPVQVNDLTWDHVEWVDLDEADGSTGSTQTGTGGVTWQDAGNITTAPIPGNVAVLMNKVVPSARGRRNGRTYWCGVPEADTSDAAPNSLSGGQLTAWQTACDDWLASVNQDGDATSYDSRLCVVHILTRDTPNPGQELGSPLTGESHDVTEVSVQGLLATQRRRLRG